MAVDISLQPAEGSWRKPAEGSSWEPAEGSIYPLADPEDPGEDLHMPLSGGRC